MPNVFYSTSFKNYLSFSLQVPSILSILLAAHNPLTGNLPKARMFALSSTICNIFFFWWEGGEGGGGIGIFINTVLEEASQISDYRPGGPPPPPAAG